MAIHCRERAGRAGIQSEGRAGRAAGDGGVGSGVAGAVVGEARLLVVPKQPNQVERLKQLVPNRVERL